MEWFLLESRVIHVKVCRWCRPWYYQGMSYTGIANPRRTRLIDLHPEPAAEQIDDTTQTASTPIPVDEPDTIIQ
ncbi:hypothetical protein SAMN04487818_11825 [Actinokineospora terrae]|uniref:Uncharacterized protein n=1 Tax=Actinokineospora terrae TaxID=155974 RepID=A0A1H9XQ10_9PSEU|nr:hypothetical protein SAMN04487818_11825 [Actinokineospora terrae]